MPNCYASLTEIKAAMPDGVRAAITKYDSLIFRLANEVSRWIDNECKRLFYQIQGVGYFDGSGDRDLWVSDLISITTVEYSWDYGQTYTVLSPSDYIATVAGDYNRLESYTLLQTKLYGTTLLYWPQGQRSVRITGIWGYADDRNAVFEDTGDTVQNVGTLASNGLSLKVNSVAGLDPYGAITRFQPGQLLKIENEFIETTLAIDVPTNTIGILRGRNGSVAAAHNQNVAISVWRPPEPVKAATEIQCNRQMERGFQGFGDARSQPDVGQMFWFKSLDPEAARKLSNYLSLEIQ